MQRRELRTLARFGCHQLIQLCVLRELIRKRHKGATYLDQSVSGFHIGDIAHLQVRDVEQLGKLQAVG